MTFLGMPTAPRGVGQLRQEAPFPVAAARALDDSQLRRNLGHATSTIRAKRAAAVAEVPDWQELRAAGAAIKDEVLAHLDRYLLQLEEQVTARGGTVHWAGDANEANRIVTGLIRATGQRHVVKVKSMATQEIGLNEALAAAGIEATETDLAELIVQLGHDRPSHILVPAIHRNRNQIRDIFLREMPDAPAQLSDEPAALTAAARAHLRRKFLTAQVAISGANFAIAETGTLAVVESEGNGRMCLTLPRTLITVMGIEKILPAWRDLEVFLQLLPRSSTAERMNPYTSMWAGAVEGQEFHLVLLDNGRTARPGRAALHQVLGLPERVPGLRAHRRARLRLGLPRADRSRAVAPADRRGRQPGPAVRVDPVRRVLRRLPGRDRHSFDARPPPLPGGRRQTRPPPRPDARSRRHARPGLDDERPAPLDLGPAGRSRRAAAGAALRPDPAPARPAGRLDLLPRPAPAAATDVPRLVEGGAVPVSSREEMLARIHAATADITGLPEVPRRYQPAGRGPGSADEALVSLFEERASDYRATVRRCAAAEVAQVIADAVAARGAGRIGVPRGFPALWSALLPGPVFDDPPLDVAALDALDGVVTTCAVAIAETGTIVLDTGPGQGSRAFTLVPDYHLAVVRTGQIVAAVPDAVAALNPVRPLTWISGPSATSDIELSRVEGVHGPRTLDIVIVAD
jgi:L-lactate utilization protein LutB